MICCQRFFNSEEGSGGESFLFGDSEKKEEEEEEEGGGGLRRREGWQEDEKGGGERLMRLLGFNQYGIWPENDWKTNLIWEAIRLSFISPAVSPVDLPGSYCHLFQFNTHHGDCRVCVYNNHLNEANKQACPTSETLRPM